MHPTFRIGLLQGVSKVDEAISPSFAVVFVITNTDVTDQAPY